MGKIIDEFSLLHKLENWIVFASYMKMEQTYRLQWTMEQHLVALVFYFIDEKDYSEEKKKTKQKYFALISWVFIRLSSYL